MATVETALGPVDASELGTVLSHEHLLVSLGDDLHRYRWMFDMERTRQNAIAELQEARAGGVDTLIDLTTPDLGRDVRFVQEVAREAGVHVVVATGVWRDLSLSFRARTPDENAEIFVHEIEQGIDETGIKAGAIKVANDAEGVAPEYETVLRGAARATKRTGCPISTHHWAPLKVGLRQVEIFREEGAPMDRICIGHSADSTDVDYLETLLRAGVYLSMDRYPGSGDRPNWEQRNATVKALVDRGWAQRLMLGHDHAPLPVRAAAVDRPRAEPTRYTFLNRVALPALREAGVSEGAVHAMMVEVPRRFLTGESE